MTEKMYYLVGDTQNGKMYERFDSYDEAMYYIKREYTYDKEHEGKPDSTFIDGYYGIYRISEEAVERFGWDYVYSNWETTEFLGEVSYEKAMNFERS